jgi:tRNA(Ile)-lysidine synthase
MDRDRTRSLTPKAVCVAFSGGLDSTVLLDMLHRTGRHDLTAVHVHHGLSPNADAWAEHAQAFCDARRIPLTIERVSVDRDSPLGLEGAAREARYAVFAKRPEPVVALAHHQDDQAETVLLQILRGTGLKGVAAMPEHRKLNDHVTLWRPLLGMPRAQLQAYAKEHGLAWIDDESNASDTHDRNYLRLQAAPILDVRFPNWRLALARFARHAAEADALLTTLAEIDGLAAPDAPLVLDAALPPARRINLVRAWLARRGLPMPSESHLQEITRQAFEAAPDARVEMRHGGHRIVRHAGKLHMDLEAPGPLDRPWQGETRVDLAERGVVEFEPCEGEGIAAAHVSDSGWHFRERRGGERFRGNEASTSNSLKTLLQERGIPWWWRQKLPLLFHHDTLVWFPGSVVAGAYRAGQGQKGLRPCWRLAGKPALC